MLAIKRFAIVIERLQKNDIGTEHDHSCILNWQDDMKWPLNEWKPYMLASVKASPSNVANNYRLKNPFIGVKWHHFHTKHH